jgi:hypothetical protein
MIWLRIILEFLGKPGEKSIDEIYFLCREPRFLEQVRSQKHHSQALSMTSKIRPDWLTEFLVVFQIVVSNINGLATAIFAIRLQ